MKIWWFLLVFGSQWVLADQFHYNNVLLGERAQGMGGAFTAVADDASGVVYNPGGLAFALSNDISGSANAFYSRKVTYKKAAFDKDFVENSEGSISPFVGALGKLDHLSPGMVFAFGIYTSDSELKDQDDFLVNNSNTSQLHRTANVRANTNHIGLAIAKRFGGRFGIGFGLTYISVNELTQIYQDSVSLRTGATDETANNIYRRTLTQNVRELLEVQAIEPALGVQLALGTKFSWGLTLKKAFILWQNYEIGNETTVVYEDASGSGQVVDKSAGGFTDTFRTQNVRTTEKDPLGEWPMEVRTGIAWFASTTFLATFDVIYRGAAEGEVSAYEREAVTNFALGTEFFVTPTYPIRFGLFTNNDSRPEVESGKANQRDHIDYMGYTLFFAFVQPNSQIALGTILQSGEGKAQKVAGSTQIQDVEAFAYSVGFSVSHNF